LLAVATDRPGREETVTTNQPRRQPGKARRIRLADVAERAGVSAMLVSLVMRGRPGASPANRERVLQVARELGYVPDARARVLRQERTNLLGVTFNLQQPFHADLVEGIYSAADAAGYEVVLSAVTDTRREDRAIETLLAERCEALILLGPQTPKRQLVDLAARLPVLVVARSIADPSIDVVRTADAKGIQLAVDHLVGLGHTHIAHVDGGDAPGATQRRKGYREAMRRHELTDFAQVVHGGLKDDDGARATRQLLDSPHPPTGILAFNDRCATGVLDALYRSRLVVPDDLSVVGFDDTHVAAFSHVDLTTVRQDAAVMARLAVEQAVGRLDEDDPREGNHQTVVAPTLVVRGTTGPPPSPNN
jgi:DNA-binding LacI/PurR family transcriptional regulator